MKTFNNYFIKIVLIFVILFGLGKTTHSLFEEGYPYIAFIVAPLGIIILANLIYKLFKNQINK